MMKVIHMKRIKVGNKYKLDGASQFTYTRENKLVRIEPRQIVTKIKDKWSDKFRLRDMYRTEYNGETVEIDIDSSIIDRYFVKVN